MILGCGEKGNEHPLASYFFLPLLVARAFATKASNRGSP